MAFALSKAFDRHSSPFARREAASHAEWRLPLQANLPIIGIGPPAGKTLPDRARRRFSAAAVGGKYA
jgi:hypothetical protein